MRRFLPPCFALLAVLFAAPALAQHGMAKPNPVLTEIVTGMPKGDSQEI